MITVGNKPVTGVVSVSQNTLSIGGNYVGEVSNTYDVTLHNNGTTFDSLGALLSDANLNTLIPLAVRKGGMSIKFVQSSDNKYVQYRYMGTDITGNPNPFLDTANWQKQGAEVTISQTISAVKSVINIGGETYNVANENVANSVEKAIGYEFNIYDKTVQAESYYNTAYLTTGTTLRLQNISGTNGVGFYAFREDSTYVTLAEIQAGQTATVTLTEDFVRLQIYSSTSHHVKIDVVKEGLIDADIFNQIKNCNLKSISESGILSSGTYPQYETNSFVINDGVLYYLSEEGENLTETYIIWSDGSYTNITIGWNRMKYPNGKTFKSIRVIGTGGGQSVTVGVKIISKDFESAVDELTPNLEQYRESGTSTGGQYAQYNSQNINIPNGYYFNVINSGYSEMYIIWSDESYTAISSGWRKMEYPNGKTFKNIRVLTGGQTVNVNLEVLVAPEYWMQTVWGLSNEFNSQIRALILGDSYSDNGGQWVGPMMSKLPTGSSYISLAVSSASLKDHYQDRETYPYTSRPVSSDNTGNHNTLACQIQKLKRLMAGTDLDEGETQIYTNPSEYPNVIIIAGGKNDYFDNDEVVATYYSQLNKTVNNVYRKQKLSSAVELGSVTIKTPLDEINRTCFAGAYRYLLDELLALFPNAQIYFATVSPLGYRNGTDVAEVSTKIVQQQRLCADIFNANVIDWYRDGQINSIANYARGSGTQEDPYIWGEQSGSYIDTNDQLHPNARGGKKYGYLAANVIKQTF